jgi:hypothetical protein
MEAPDVRRRLRHDLRGAFHNLRLCVEVLVRETDPAEALPWLEQIEQAADACDRNAESLMALSESPAAPQDPGRPNQA